MRDSVFAAPAHRLWLPPNGSDAHCSDAASTLVCLMTSDFDIGDDSHEVPQYSGPVQDP
jgi:hypothetical protein